MSVGTALRVLPEKIRTELIGKIREHGYRICSCCNGYGNIEQIDRIANSCGHHSCPVCNYEFEVCVKCNGFGVLND